MVGVDFVLSRFKVSADSPSKMMSDCVVVFCCCCCWVFLLFFLVADVIIAQSPKYLMQYFHLSCRSCLLRGLEYILSIQKADGSWEG